MTINKVSLTTQSIKENTDVTIEILQARPVSGQYLDIPVRPNTLYGFYSHAANYVELYLSSSNGRRYLRIR